MDIKIFQVDLCTLQFITNHLGYFQTFSKNFYYKNSAHKNTIFLHAILRKISSLAVIQNLSAYMVRGAESLQAVHISASSLHY